MIDLSTMPPGCDALCDCCGDPCDAETGRDDRDDHVLCATCDEQLRPVRLDAHRYLDAAE